MPALAVALDVTPLVGPPTGIPNSIASTLAAIGSLATDGGAAEVRIVPYALSLRARSHRDALPPGTVFPPIPARLALAAWSHLERPTIDRWLGPARVLHATNYLAPPSALPTLVTVHDCAFVRYPELCTPEVRALVPIVRRAVSRGATIHAPSRFVADEVAEIFGADLAADGRIHVVPWGVPALVEPDPLEAATHELVSGGPYVLSLGTLEPRKNLPHLVSAFGRVAATLADLRLVIAGPDGAATAAVERAIDALPATAARRVIRTGPVTEATKASLLSHAVALAYPSISEGFGFPVLEAMAASAPVIAARAGSIPEVAGDAALLVDATDEDALAAAIQRIHDDDALRSELISLGHDRVARFSWANTAAQLLTVYRRLAG